MSCKFYSMDWSVISQRFIKECKTAKSQTTFNVTIDEQNMRLWQVVLTAPSGDLELRADATSIITTVKSIVSPDEISHKTISHLLYLKK